LAHEIDGKIRALKATRRKLLDRRGLCRKCRKQPQAPDCNLCERCNGSLIDARYIMRERIIEEGL
jgi:hypothetical protein